MKNKISDLNNHLFAQLERLSDEDLNEEDLKKEIERARAISNISKNIIESTKTAFEGMKLMERAGYDIGPAAGRMLETGERKGGPK